jgi:hypothetical protein
MQFYHWALPINLLDGDRIDAFAGEHSVQFIRNQDPATFTITSTHTDKNPYQSQR